MCACVCVCVFYAAHFESAKVSSSYHYSVCGKGMISVPTITVCVGERDDFSSHHYSVCGKGMISVPTITVCVGKG